MSELQSIYLNTAEVARLLHVNEKKIYVLAAAGKLPTVRISGKWLFPRELLLAQLGQQTRVPGEGLLQRLLPSLFLIEGSDDLLFRELIPRAGKDAGYPVAFGVLGTAGGLRMLARRQVHAATVHFPHEAAVAPAAALPGEDCALLSLYRRQQGWMQRRARSVELRSAADVAGQRLRFADREPDCATHTLAQALFRREGLDLAALPARAGPYLTHLEAAAAVAAGAADVALGVREAAERCGLAFDPVTEEEFCLAVPGRHLAEPGVLRLFDVLLESIRRAPAVLVAGYDRGCTGSLRVIPGAAGPARPSDRDEGYAASSAGEARGRDAEQ